MTDDTPAKPAPISRRVRFEILRRDGHTCRYCGAQAPDVPLTVDHVIPRALGGSDDPSNLVTACRDCNSGKGSTSPDEHIVADVDAASLLFAKALERAAEIRTADRAAMDLLLEQFDSEWSVWKYGENPMPRPNDWAQSVERFVAAGLTMADFQYYIDVAMRARTNNGGCWRYFCGCCWRCVADRQELARQLIEDGKV